MSSGALGTGAAEGHSWPAGTDVRVKGKLRALLYFIVQELCESRGGRPALSILTSLLVSVDVKLRHWYQLVPKMSTDI